MKIFVSVRDHQKQEKKLGNQSIRGELILEHKFKIKNIKEEWE